MLFDYRKSHLAPDYGQAYERRFHENPYRSLMWELEQRVLTRIVELFYNGRTIRHLDFACGTGRILAHLENFTTTSVGVDLSPSMLEVARQKLERGEIIEADITRNDVLGDRKFNLITAFRFFPNAQPQLRLQTMRQLVKHLDTDGFIVFNNHKNLSSLTYRLARLLRRRSGNYGMNITEVQNLLSEVGLKVAKIYHIGVIPSTENHRLLPRPLLRILEAALSRCAIFHNLAQNVIFVCKCAER